MQAADPMEPARKRLRRMGGAQDELLTPLSRVAGPDSPFLPKFAFDWYQEPQPRAHPTRREPPLHLRSPVGARANRAMLAIRVR